MRVYAGIDEAGYGPLFGPLVVGATAWHVPEGWAPTDGAGGVDWWARWSDAVSPTLGERRGRVPVGDSKKLHTPASGPRHLEPACLGLLQWMGVACGDLGQWLDGLGVEAHRRDEVPAWYAATAERPWQALGAFHTPGEQTIATGAIRRAGRREGVTPALAAAAVLFEPTFNERVAATRSKASVAFTCVAGHLRRLWDEHGESGVLAAVDRQSGRTHYREPLAQNFPEASMRVLAEGPERSAYELRGPGGRRMEVSFEVEAESRHLPVAWASMVCKYTREMLMARFQGWFSQRLPEVKPTAGYGTDGVRFWKELRPRLKSLGLAESQVKRMA